MVNVIPSPVYAATQDRTVEAEGSIVGGTYAGGGSAGDYTDLNSNDDLTSYLNFGAPVSPWENWHTYYFQDFTTANIGINSVKLTYRVRSDAATVYVTPFVYIAGTIYIDAGDAVAQGTAFTTRTKTWTNNPATGVAWTINDLDDTGDGAKAQFGVRHSTSTGTYTYWTYAFITVDYDPPTYATVTTNSATSVTNTAATLNGSISSLGGWPECTNYGFVWDTVSRADPGNVAPAASAYANNWTAGAGSYGIGSYNRPLGAVLVANTTYYFRFAALNGTGWKYGTQISFKTHDTPTITTVNASSIATYTARLNATVTKDGEENCTVRFAYARTALGPFANYAAIVAAGVEVTAVGTYRTGQQPYYDIAGLLATTGYTFACRIDNAIGTAYGNQLTFTTLSGVFEPTNVKAIPGDDGVSISWTKGTGSTRTLVRYNLNAYPATTADGTLAYFDTGASVLITGLQPGTTIYVSLWGESANVYSAGYSTILSTSLAKSEAEVSVPIPGTPGGWFATPNYTNMAVLPIYDLVNWWSDVFTIPRGSMWFFLAILVSAGFGLLLYKVSDKIPIALMGCALALIVCWLAGIMAAWLAFTFLAFAAATWVIGERV